MATIEQIADRNGGLPVTKEADGGIEIGGILAGRQLEEGLFAEQVMAGRWLIRSTRGGLSYPSRVGEVMGGEGRFVCCQMNGEHVGTASTVLHGARLLASKKAGAA